MASAEYTIYLALQNALQADSTLTALIPAANIIVGPREAEAPIPSTCITTVSPGVTVATQGAKASGGVYTRNPTFQFESAIVGTMITIIDICDAIFEVLMGDNAILNAVGIQNVDEVGLMEYYDERKSLCRAQRFSFAYRFRRGSSP